MADVFVSYTREDRGRVEQLAHALEARGFDVWWDPELLPGEQYAQKISKVLTDAKAVLVCWSNSSVARPWVLDEAGVGRDRGVLVPVLIETVDAPLGFRQMQAEDLSGWPDASHEPNFERIVRALESLRGAPAAPRPAGPAPGATAKRAGLVGDPGAAKPKSRRALYVVGGAVLAVLAVIAIFQIANPNAGGGGVPGVQASPGAGEGYGLTDKEFATLGINGVIKTALTRTTIAAIEEGANAGDARGQTLLCTAYDFGEGVEPDGGAARAWCEQASEQGQSLATYLLGVYYRDGLSGYPKDIDKAHELIETAAAANDARALFDIGDLYLRGAEGYAQDDLKALENFRKAGEQGYQDAQFNVAWMYENGRGAPRDYGTAMLWYQKLAAENSAVGIRAVGWMYYNGWGVDQKDIDKAVENYTKAAELGDGNAAFLLAQLYENGEGVPKDLDKAVALFRQASERRFEGADAELKRLGYSD